MRTPASISGHPIHPMVVPVAIGGFLLSFVFDVVWLLSGNADPWAVVSWYTMVGGIVGAVIAAFFGFADFWALPRGHLRKVGIAHMALNLTIVALFVWNAWMRYAQPGASLLPFALSFVAILMLVASGWLGGMMVYEHGVGVSEESPGGAARASSSERPQAARHVHG